MRVLNGTAVSRPFRYCARPSAADPAVAPGPTPPDIVVPALRGHSRNTFRTRTKLPAPPRLVAPVPPAVGTGCYPNTDGLRPFPSPPDGVCRDAGCTAASSPRTGPRRPARSPPPAASPPRDPAVSSPVPAPSARAHLARIVRVSHCKPSPVVSNACCKRGDPRHVPHRNRPVPAVRDGVPAAPDRDGNRPPPDACRGIPPLAEPPATRRRQSPPPRRVGT